MRGIRVLHGMLATLAGVMLAVGAVLLIWMWVAGSAGWAPWLVIVAMVGIAVAGARTLVIATPQGLRVLGESPMAWADVVSVQLVRDKDARYPQLTVARGRALENRDLDGLATLSDKRARDQVAFLATSAGAPVVDGDAGSDELPPTPRRGIS